MMTEKFALIVCSVFLGLSILAGCAAVQDNTYSSTINPDIPEPSLKLKFDDVPVPSGFKLLPSYSYSFQSGSIRAGVLVYKGMPDADRVVAFYREQMPINGWTTLSIVEYGKRLLAFDRTNETCVINVEPRSFSTRITITVSPKQQVSTSKAEKVLK